MYARSLLTAALLASPMLTKAADSDSRYLIWGLGQNSCNNYNQARAAGDDSYKHYISGYLTAYNAFVPDTYSITPGMDLSAITAWLDSYCADSQMASFADALHHLAEQMREKRERNSPDGGARWP